MLSDLLKLRDNVFIIPCPVSDNAASCISYKTALQALSAQLDELAISAVNDRQSEAENILKNLLICINQDYGIAL